MFQRLVSRALSPAIASNLSARISSKLIFPVAMTGATSIVAVKNMSTDTKGIDNLAAVDVDDTSPEVVYLDVIPDYPCRVFGVTTAAPEDGNVLVVGDIHGCYDEFVDMLEVAQFDPSKDVVVLLGDLVGKGPKSLQVIHHAMALGQSCLAIRGNHEQFLINYLDYLALHDRSPEHVHLRSRTHHKLATQLSAQDAHYLRGLPYWVSVPALGLLGVHAGCLPHQPLEAQSADTLLTLRTVKQPDGDLAAATAACLAGTAAGSASGHKGPRWAEVYNQYAQAVVGGAEHAHAPLPVPGSRPPHIVFGHDAAKRLQRLPWATGLDTGCCYGGELTALLYRRGAEGWGEPEMLRVPAREQYCPIKKK